MPILLVLASSCFVAGMTMRLIDPMVPEIARDLATDPHTIALLATAFTLPYALSQPVIGALGDAVGKVRIIRICLVAFTLMLAAAALATSIEELFLARVLGGLAGGGIIPLALALVGDRFPFQERQVSLSYLLMAILVAQIFGVVGAGLIASVLGWRPVVWIVTAMALGALIVTWRYLRPRPDVIRPPFSIERLASSYREVLDNRRALACFLAVFVDGALVMGLLPYVATLIEERGAGGLTQAGFVLAGMGLGGIAYTFRVRMLLAMAGGMINLMRWGGVVMAVGFLGIAVAGPWAFEMAAFVVTGLGFYMLHGSVQTQVTEVAPDQRGTSMALHAFFFVLGQAVGPIVYAIGFHLIGTTPSILAAGLLLGALGYATAAALERFAAPAGKG